MFNLLISYVKYKNIILELNIMYLYIYIVFYLQYDW